MSYTRTVYVGEYAKCKLNPAGGKWLHWLTQEINDTEIRQMTNGRAGVADLNALGDIHYIFPEFTPNNHVYHYIMLPGYVTMEDVGRTDSQVVIGPAVSTVSREETIAKLVNVFGFEHVTLHTGAVMEVW